MYVYIYMYVCVYVCVREREVSGIYIHISSPLLTSHNLRPSSCSLCATHTYVYMYMYHEDISAQEWRNRTLVGHEPLMCGKMCVTKTK